MDTSRKRLISFFIILTMVVTGIVTVGIGVESHAARDYGSVKMTKLQQTKSGGKYKIKATFKCNKMPKRNNKKRFYIEASLRATVKYKDSKNKVRTQNIKSHPKIYFTKRGQQKTAVLTVPQKASKVIKITNKSAKVVEYH